MQSGNPQTALNISSFFELIEYSPRGRARVPAASHCGAEIMEFYDMHVYEPAKGHGLRHNPFNAPGTTDSVRVETVVLKIIDSEKQGSAEFLRNLV